MAGTGTAHLRQDALLSVEHLVVEFNVAGRGTIHAVSDVSLDVLEGETLGLVGESGCGKSTTARAIVGYVKATSGLMRLEGRDLETLSSGELRKTRTKLQMIFQDPISSLNPRRIVEDIIEEGLRIWRLGDRNERAERVRNMMEAVGLKYDPAAKRRRTEFSGGQCQRISIARALIMDPKMVVCDEPVSALDVSVQAQVLNLFIEMRDRYSLTLLFIAHDLAVVKHISDRIIVMYSGRICEVAPPEVLYQRPAHPYTAALLAAIPIPNPALRKEKSELGEPASTSEAPSPLAPPSGCRFRTRCPYAQDKCAVDVPEIRLVGPGQYVACHYPLSGSKAD
jgi:peptide/nickel transport system ATP-binding protein